jgi:ankyrin repeat protein
VRKLLEDWDNLNTQGYSKDAALESAWKSAVRSDKFDVITMLVDFAAKNNIKIDWNWQNSNGSTALIIAVRNGYKGIELAKKLLENGAKLDIQDHNKKTALDYAKIDDMIKLLESYAPHNMHTPDWVTKSPKTSEKSDEKPVLGFDKRH